VAHLRKREDCSTAGTKANANSTTIMHASHWQIPSRAGVRMVRGFLFHVHSTYPVPYAVTARFAYHWTIHPESTASPLIEYPGAQGEAQFSRWMRVRSTSRDCGPRAAIVGAPVPRSE